MVKTHLGGAEMTLKTVCKMALNNITGAAVSFTKMHKISSYDDDDGAADDEVGFYAAISTGSGTGWVHVTEPAQ